MGRYSKPAATRAASLMQVPPVRTCRKLRRRPQDGLCRPQLHALLTCGTPKHTASSRFCSHTVQAPAKPKPLRSHSMALYGAFDVKLYIDVALLLSRGLWGAPVQRPAPMAPTRQVVWALDWLRLIVTIGGKLARGRGFSRRNLVCGRCTWDRNHDAAMRIGSEAPRGGPNLLVGIEAMWGNGTPPPRIVIGYPSRTLDERPNPLQWSAGSYRRTSGE